MKINITQVQALAKASHIDANIKLLPQLSVLQVATGATDIFFHFVFELLSFPVKLPYNNLQKLHNTYKCQVFSKLTRPV